MSDNTNPEPIPPTVVNEGPNFKKTIFLALFVISIFLALVIIYALFIYGQVSYADVKIKDLIEHQRFYYHKKVSFTGTVILSSAGALELEDDTFIIRVEKKNYTNITFNLGNNLKIQGIFDLTAKVNPVVNASYIEKIAENHTISNPIEISYPDVKYFSRLVILKNKPLLSIENSSYFSYVNILNFTFPSYILEQDLKTLNLTINKSYDIVGITIWDIEYYPEKLVIIVRILNITSVE